MKENQAFERIEIEPVEAETPSHGSANRDPAGGTFYPTGRFVLNTEAAEDTMDLVRMCDVDPTNFRVSYGRQPGTDVVAIYIRRNGEPGTAAVRANADGKTLTMYLHSLLEKHPSLRPTIKVQCHLSPGKDQKGVPCLIFNAKGGLPKLTQHKDGGSSDQAAQPKQK